MSNNRLRTASALAVSVVLLATPALGQGTAGESGDMVLLKAEIKMLKSLLTKQREQMNALQKQIADLTASVQQLRQLSAPGPTPAAPAPAPVPEPALPTPQPRPARVTELPRTTERPVVPPGFPYRPPPGPGVPPDMPRMPRPGPYQPPAQTPKTDFATIGELVNSLPANLVPPDPRISPTARIKLEQEVGFRNAGKTLTTEVAVASVKPAARGAVQIIGTAEATARGQKIPCSVTATFRPAEAAKLKQVAAGQKATVAGAIFRLGFAGAPVGQTQQPSIQVTLSECLLVSAGTAGATAAEMKPDFASVQALISALPKELISTGPESPDEAKAKSAQLAAWIQARLAGKVLAAEASVQQFNLSGGRNVRAQLYHGPPKKKSTYMCFLEGAFSGDEGNKVIRSGKGTDVKIMGRIITATIAGAARFPRIELQLRDCRVTSAAPPPADRGRRLEPPPGRPDDGRGRRLQPPGRPDERDRMLMPPIGPGGRRP